MTAVLEAAASAVEAKSATSELDHGATERLAYFRYLERGRVEGFALEDWLMNAHARLSAADLERLANGLVNTIGALATEEQDERER